MRRYIVWVEFVVRLPEDAPAEYAEFWRLWAKREYFACHEVLEALWRRETGERKQFYHGLIHCAVALYQVQRENAVGAARQFVRAQVKLSRFAPEYSGAPIEALLKSVDNEVAPLRGVLTLRQREDLKKLNLTLENHEQSGKWRGQRHS
jgi:predicted metal-dependent hydrolase